MTTATQYTEWQTYRTTNGAGRVTYHSEWDKSQPWVSYVHGTAGRHFPTLSAAKVYFAERGMTLNCEVSC